jgi:hypothetical protein
MAIIQEKAREIFEKLKRQTPGSSSEELEFKATTVWFSRFRRRSGIKHVVMLVQIKKKLRNFVANFKNS